MRNPQSFPEIYLRVKNYAPKTGLCANCQEILKYIKEVPLEWDLGYIGCGFIRRLISYELNSFVLTQVLYSEPLD